ncbi:hypothetical protein B566_EDAN004511 [Ephemera danica]|nr:hypothetical protein B566_EDAN004511 [Ephemera danica]
MSTYRRRNFIVQCCSYQSCNVISRTRTTSNEPKLPIEIDPPDIGEEIVIDDSGTGGTGTGSSGTGTNTGIGGTGSGTGTGGTGTGGTITTTGTGGTATGGGTITGGPTLGGGSATTASANAMLSNLSPAQMAAVAAAAAKAGVTLPPPGATTNSGGGAATTVAPSGGGVTTLAPSGGVTTTQAPSGGGLATSPAGGAPTTMDPAVVAMLEKAGITTPPPGVTLSAAQEAQLAAAMAAMGITTPAAELRVADATAQLFQPMNLGIWRGIGNVGVQRAPSRVIIMSTYRRRNFIVQCCSYQSCNVISRTRTTSNEIILDGVSTVGTGDVANVTDEPMLPIEIDPPDIGEEIVIDDSGTGGTGTGGTVTTTGIGGTGTGGTATGTSGGTTLGGGSATTASANAMLSNLSPAQMAAVAAAAAKAGVTLPPPGATTNSAQAAQMQEVLIAAGVLTTTANPGKLILDLNTFIKLS